MSPPSSTAGTQGSGSKNSHARQASSSSNSSIRIARPDLKPSSQTPSDRPASVNTVESSNPSVKSDSKSDRAAEQSAQPSDKSTSSSAGTPPSQPSLKLFPDVAPPRMSSKNAWRISSVPQYQRPPNPPSMTESGCQIETLGNKPTSEKQKPSEAPSRISKDEEEPSCSGAIAVTSAVFMESATAEIAKSQAGTKTTARARPPSLAMGTLKAFPLPAPMKPLPSIPQPGRSPPAVPDAKVNPTVRSVRSTLSVPDRQPSHPSPIAEDPREPDACESEHSGGTRPATALGYVGEAESEADHDSAKSIHTPKRPESTSPEQSTPRRRASSIRIPYMQNLPESPPGCDENEGIPLADSPILGQITPTKSPGKHAARKALQINPHVDRKNLPFGLPSPPPTAALPSNPPAQPLPERSHGSRNYSAPVPTSVHSAKGMDTTLAPGHHRGSMISRSDSSRSSLLHESIPESYEPSRYESPLPSSDDEGFGPNSDTSRSHRTVEKYPKRAHPLRRGYETVGARPSHDRLRYPHPVRSQTPQGRTRRVLEESAMSPQSTYSESTYRSRDSHSSRIQPGTSHMAHYLEDRIANLERQNQILQAALLAALNAGVKNPLDSLGESVLPPGFSPAGPYQSRFTSRPGSWVSSSRSSEQSGSETQGSYRDGRPSVRQLDDMIEDIEGGDWMSDKSSRSGARMARNR
ncbi:uncharacterized protein N7482_004897 [Penicillium canariense]|uniref:Uncharacterized protein n=1 Tax=Penicillium canariense TaxID=189055 RepID=A0A9W9I1I7_9EURO|nr:uncharacterized protein N7482_004897 [Penicillium canariense]KAJ5166116.1 hypothetical protein N7482_004897 [Penicillium canariense]